MTKEQRSAYNKRPDQVAKRKAWRLANPMKDKQYDLWRYYGLSLADYEALIARQSNTCPICQQPFTIDNIASVDHKHVPGYDGMPPAEKRRHVRGVLHRDCNSAIGLLKDSASNCSNAAAYLRNEQFIFSIPTL
jgi:hypothetical protein